MRGLFTLRCHCSGLARHLTFFFIHRSWWRETSNTQQFWIVTVWDCFIFWSFVIRAKGGSLDVLFGVYHYHHVLIIFFSFKIAFSNIFTLHPSTNDLWFFFFLNMCHSSWCISWSFAFALYYRSFWFACDYHTAIFVFALNCSYSHHLLGSSQLSITITYLPIYLLRISWLRRSITYFLLSYMAATLNKRSIETLQDNLWASLLQTLING